MKKILVATDFSERSDRALRRAALLARELATSISLIHVVDDDQPRRIVDAERAEAEQLLWQMTATLRDVDGIRSDARVILGSPFAGIAEAAEATAPDLLIVGPHRRQILRDVFVGTTAERIIRSVGCPVLMVNAPPAGQYRHVMRTTDLSEGSRNAMQRVEALGIGTRARRSVLYVFDAPALHLMRVNTVVKEEREHYLADERMNAAQQLSDFLSSAGIHGLETILRNEEAPAAFEILKVAEKERADLVVLATHGRGGLAKLVIGSVTEQVLRASAVDVLAIPPAHAD
ncbi:universal stress protein [Aquisalinus flavus]|nr:universal stress protein [Aquisalinus flavus]MBD0425790.1 universal stress protein [Aquisalinus flavus]UNE48604.1 universal stress protein [Aquisalinus flavus]